MLKSFQYVYQDVLQVAADSIFSFSSLIHRHSRIVDDFQEGNDSMALAVRAVNTGVRRADIGPVVT